MPVTLQTQDGVAVITLDRPERRNALDMDAWRELRACAAAVTGVRAVVVTGAGGHFCAGMDLSPDNPVVQKVGPAIFEGEEAPAREVIEELKACVQALADVPVPVFAAIEGACVGGGYEVALACDVRIAARSANIGLTETRVGMIPDIGGCARLTRLVGPGRAADVICTARRLDADEAFRLGCVERVVDAGQAFAVAMEAARAVAANAPIATELALKVVRRAPDLGLTEALSLETQAGVMALTSGEPREGIGAFLEKRAPRWS